MSPISDAGSPVRLRSDHVRKYIVGEALEPFDFTVRRADTMNGSGIITEQIVTELLNADLVVADLTDHNPNVFYELALRHAVKKPFIHMIKDGEKIPFDVATLRTVFTTPRTQTACMRRRCQFARRPRRLSTPATITR